MLSNRNKFYAFMLIACIAGYIWLYFNLSKDYILGGQVEACLIKHVTNIPCPSCGTTRSVVSIVNGDFIAALALNPLGYLIALIMLISPIWILIDFISKNNSFFVFFQKLETIIKKPKLALPLILLVVFNWIWNISKGL